MGNDVNRRFVLGTPFLFFFVFLLCRGTSAGCMPNEAEHGQHVGARHHFQGCVGGR